MIFIAKKNIHLRDDFFYPYYFPIENFCYYTNEFSSYGRIFIIMINVHHNDEGSSQQNFITMMNFLHNTRFSSQGWFLFITMKNFYLRDYFSSQLISSKFDFLNTINFSSQIRIFITIVNFQTVIIDRPILLTDTIISILIPVLVSVLTKFQYR